jgi:heme-degrading monooxygenase HmoA
MISNTPAAPYYAVIFTSLRTEGDNGYEEMAELMERLVAQQPGFLGMESARNELGITVSYWASTEAIRAWKEVLEHKLAQEKGRTTWYRQYKVRICKVERDYAFTL